MRRSRWKNRAKAWGAGASPADAKAATTAADRAVKASGIDERLGFRGKDGVAHALKGIGKVVGLTVGGCAELSSTVHRLVHHLATQAGERETKDTGEEVEECILAQKQRIGRRIARQVWRDIHQHSTARRRFVGQPPDPTHNGPSRRTQLRRMNEDEAIYQLQKERWDEEEQGETMLTRRANERLVYARQGPANGRRVWPRRAQGRQGPPWKAAEGRRRPPWKAPERRKGFPGRPPGFPPGGGVIAPFAGPCSVAQALGTSTPASTGPNK